MSEERLQKILARAGVASRRKIEELIREARVTINGRLAELGDKADLERDAVKVDGKRIQASRGAHHYLLLNKPKGVMSTVADPEGRTTVLELVPPALRKALVPVGRLDYLTEGLLLLTDDGELAQRVAHPRYGCTKTYEVKVKGRPSDDEIAKLEAGVMLEGRRTSPSRITPRPVPRRHEDMDNSWWFVELTEGRTRQIREMFFRIGHPVQKLRRIAIGPVSDPDLPVGALRDLTEKEVESLRRSATKPEPKPRVRKSRATAAPEPAAESSEARAERPRPARRPAVRKPGEREGRTGRTGPRAGRIAAAARPEPAEPESGRTGWDFDDDETPVSAPAPAVRESGPRRRAGGSGEREPRGRGTGRPAPGGRPRAGAAARPGREGAPAPRRGTGPGRGPSSGAPSSGASRSAGPGRSARAGRPGGAGDGRSAGAGRPGGAGASRTSAGPSRTAGSRPAGRGKPAGAGPRGAGPAKRGGPGRGPGGGRSGGRPGGGPRRGKG